MKKSPVILGFVSVLLLSITTSAYSENHVDIFNLARKNDPQWASKKQKYLADREKVEQASGTMLPTAEASAAWAWQQYDGEVINQDIIYDIFSAENLFCWLNAYDNGSTEEFDQCTSQLNATTESSSSYSTTQYGITVTQPLIRMDRWHRYKRAQILDNGAKADLAHAQ